MEGHSQAERRRRAIQKALSEVEPARRSEVAERAEQAPVLYRASFIKAADGTATPREAIRAHCLHCCGWDRSAVAECTGRACPLWAYRPGDRARKRAEGRSGAGFGDPESTISPAIGVQYPGDSSALRDREFRSGEATT